VALGFIPAIWGLWQFIHLAKSPHTLNDLGDLGSYFQGAVGSLWALAGLMFIYVAFLGQMLQLVKQDEELEAQKRNFALQQFENGFFQLLDLHNDIAKGMHETIVSHIGYYSTEGDGILPKHEYGRHLFEKWYGKLKYELESTDNQTHLAVLLVSQNTQEGKLEVKRGYVNKIYKKFYNDHQSELGHYFINLYHVFKFVNTCDVLKDKADTFTDKDNEQTIKNKRRYTSIARAQLSQYELALLFYNGISDNGKEDFKPLIEKFGLLDNFNFNDLPDQDHKALYELDACY